MRLILILSLVLFGCRSADFHYQKFQKKGGKITCVSDTIQVLDTIVFNGDTIYQWRDKLIVKDSIHYLTKWEVKYLYKEKKQQEKTERAKDKQEEKTERTTVRKKESTAKKTVKQQEKTERAKSRWWIWLLVGFCLNSFLRHLWTIIKAFNIPLSK